MAAIRHRETANDEQHVFRERAAVPVGVGKS
jgi:hypothetical protein